MEYINIEMLNIFELCECKDRSNPIISACSCLNPPVFLCSSCILDHLNQPHAHKLISELDALQKRDNAVLHHYGLVPQIYSDLKSDMIAHITQLISFREALIQSKQEILNTITQIYDRNINILGNQEHFAIDRSRDVSHKIRNLTDEGRSTLDDYSRHGLTAILGDYPKEFSLNDHPIKNCLEDIIYIGSNLKPKLDDLESKSTSIQPSADYKMNIKQKKEINPKFEKQENTEESKIQFRSHFPVKIEEEQCYKKHIPSLSFQKISPEVLLVGSSLIISEEQQKNSILNFVISQKLNEIDFRVGLEKFVKFSFEKVTLAETGLETINLMKRNVYSQHLNSYYIEELTYHFCFTTACMLPDESIMIFGQSLLENKDVIYKYSTITGKASEIQPLSKHRHQFSVCVYRNYVYVIGGVTNDSETRIIERVKCSGFIWNKLKNVNNLARSNAFSWGVSDYILIIGGGVPAECIDLRDLKARRLSWNLQIDDLFNIIEKDDFIYVLNGTAKLLFSKNLEYIGLLEPETNCSLVPKPKKRKS